MPRRKKSEDLEQDAGEALEAGRHIASLERAGFKDLVDEVRARARAEGKNVTDKLAEVLQAGLTYENYSDITLAQTMKVLDFVERVMNKFILPIMQQVGMFQIQSNIQQVQSIAEALGYMPREVAERLAEEKAREMQEKEKGVVTKFIDKLSEVIATKIGEETIRHLIETGQLDSFLDAIGELALKSIAGGGSGSKQTQQG